MAWPPSTGGGATSYNGTVALEAATRIGTITDFDTRAGTPIEISSADALTAKVTDPNGQINLAFEGAVTLDAGSVRLGNGFGGSGAVILQRAEGLPFDTSLFANGAIALGGSNIARVALSSDAALIVRSTGSITDVPVDTLLLHGTDVIDNDGTPHTLALSGNRVIYEATSPGANKVLNTSVGQLDAALGLGRSLTVNESDFLSLGSISTAGNVTVTATGIFDDGLATVVAGNTVKFTGVTLGTFGNKLDTAATILDLTATNGGDINVREADNVLLSANTNGNVDVATLDGAMTVTSASGHDVLLATGGSVRRDLTVAGGVGAGSVLSLTAVGAGGSILLNAPISSGGDVILTAGTPGNEGLIVAGGNQITAGGLLRMTAASLGTPGGAMATAADRIEAHASNGGVFITEADDLTDLTATATAGAVNVQTIDGSMSATAVAGDSVTVRAGGAARNLAITGPIDGRSGPVQLIAGGANGTIAVDGTVSTTGNVTLMAGTMGARGAISAGSGNLVGGNIVTVAGSSIGDVGSRLNTSASTLNISAINDVYVQEVNDVSLMGQSTSGSMNVATTNGTLTTTFVRGVGVSLAAGGADRDLILNGLIDGTSGAVTLAATGAGGEINVNSNVATANDVTLTAGTAGNRGAIRFGGGALVTANAVTATGLSIGDGTLRLNTNATSLDATSEGGGIFAQEVNGLELNASAAGGRVDVLTMNGALNVTAASGDGVVLEAGGAGNVLTVNGAVDGRTGPVTLRAGGAITGNGSNLIEGDAVTLTGASIGASGARLNTNAVSLNATSTNGGIYVQEADALDLTASATGGVLDVATTDGALTVASASGAGVVLTTGGAGRDITLNGAVNGGLGDVMLNATGDASGLHLNGLLTTMGNVALTAGSAGSRGAIVAGPGEQIIANRLAMMGSTIGTEIARLATTVAILDAMTASGGAFIMESDGLTSLTADVSGGIADIQTIDGSMGVTSAIGDGVTLIAGGAGNTLTIDGPVDGRADAIELAAAGAGGTIVLNGSVSSADEIIVNAGTAGDRGAIVAGAGNQVTGDRVSMQALSIGSAASRLNTQAATLNVTSSNGGIYVQEADSLGLAASATGGVLDVATSNGTLTVGQASGTGVTLLSGGAGQDIHVIGTVDGGSGDVALSAIGDGSGISLDALLTTTGGVTLTAGSAMSRGAIAAGAAGQIVAHDLTATGSAVGTSGARLATTVTSLNTASTNGGTFITESDGVTLTASAIGGIADIETIDGSLLETSATGSGVRLIAGGSGNVLTLNGAVGGGAGAVTLAASGAGGGVNMNNTVSTTGNVSISAGTAASRGALALGGTNSLSGDEITIAGTSVGGLGAPLRTTATSLNVTSGDGDIFIQETDGLTLTAHATGGALNVETLNGALDVVTASGNGVTLASAGAGNGITIAGPVDGGAGDVVLMAKGSGAGIVVNGGMTATGNMTLDAGAAIALNGGMTTTGNVTLDAGTDISLNGVMSTLGTVTLDAGAAASGGAITAGAGARINANALTARGASIGAAGARLNTSVASLDLTSTNGGAFVRETDSTTLTAHAPGGALDVSTANGALTVNSALAEGVALSAGGAGGTLAIKGAVNGGSSDVSLDASGGATLNGAVSTTGNLSLNTGAGGVIALNAALSGDQVRINAGTAASRAAVVAGNEAQINANELFVTASQLGTAAARVGTTVNSLEAQTTSGGIFVTESDALVFKASATGGALDVQTTNGELFAIAASGQGVALTAGGAGNGITLNGAVDAGAGNVALTAGSSANRGAIVAGPGNLVTGGTLTASASSIGSTAAPLKTNVNALIADASTGDVFISEQNGLTLTDVRAGNDVNVIATSGDVTVGVVEAANHATLTASAGVIADDADDSTRVSARNVTLLARSIGAPSTLSGATLDHSLRVDTAATTLDATATAGGVFIDETDGLDSVRVHASGGTTADVELLTELGDLQLQSVSAADTLLLAAGGNIVGLPGVGTISARAAELRAGGADSSAGHIGTVAQPLSLQLSPGKTLRLFVPDTINAGDASRAPSIAPMLDVTSTRGVITVPDRLSVQAGFGQLGLQAEPTPLQIQAVPLLQVPGLDWADIEPNVHLLTISDPAVCEPEEQRDAEGKAGC